jgi:solute carrier family 13 (sodium-dependent dicarboxylate transporter), member 2/3/5
MSESKIKVGYFMLNIATEKVYKKIIKKYIATIKLGTGPLFFLFVVFILPMSGFTYSARGAIGTIIWMAMWWILRPVHIGITGLLPIIVNSLFNFVPVEDILTSYASPIIILLLGANMITVSWSLWGLDKRIALRVLYFIGTTIKQQLIVWFGISTTLTIFLPNLVVAAVLTPIAISMFKYIELDKNIKNSNVSTAILLAIAWGTGLGGFGSPIGGAMNLIAIEYIEENIIGREYMFWTWTTRMLPMLIIVSVPILLYLMSFKFEMKKLPGSKQFFKERYMEEGSMSKGEKWSLFLFVIAAFLAFGRPFYKNIFPNLVPSYIFLIFGILTFILPGNNGKRLSTWKYTESRLMWGLFLLLGGGIAIGKFISLSGAGETIAKILTKANIGGGILAITFIVFLGILLSNISSNTAAVAILIPIVGNFIKLAGLNPISYIYIASVACNCAYILPTSVRAIPVGYGLAPEKLFSKGLLAILISFLVVTIFGYIFIMYWSGFSFA